MLNSQSPLFCPSSEPLRYPHNPDISDAAFCSNWGVSKCRQCWVTIGGSLQAQCRAPQTLSCPPGAQAALAIITQRLTRNRKKGRLHTPLEHCQGSHTRNPSFG